MRDRGVTDKMEGGAACNGGEKKDQLQRPAWHSLGGGAGDPPVMGPASGLVFSLGEQPKPVVQSCASCLAQPVAQLERGPWLDS